MKTKTQPSLSFHSKNLRSFNPFSSRDIQEPFHQVFDYPLPYRVKLLVETTKKQRNRKAQPEKTTQETEIKLVVDPDFLNDDAWQQALGIDREECFTQLNEHALKDTLEGKNIRKTLASEIMSVLSTLSEHGEKLKLILPDSLSQQRWSELYRKKDVQGQQEFCSQQAVCQRYLEARQQGKLPIATYPCHKSLKMCTMLLQKAGIPLDEGPTEVWIWTQQETEWQLSSFDEEKISNALSRGDFINTSDEKGYRTHLLWVTGIGYYLLREVKILPQEIHHIIQPNNFDEKVELSGEGTSQSSSENKVNFFPFHQEAVFSAIQADNEPLLRILLSSTAVENRLKECITRKQKNIENKRNLNDDRSKLMEKLFDELSDCIRNNKLRNILTSKKNTQTSSTAEILKTELFTVIREQLKKVFQKNQLSSKKNRDIFATSFDINKDNLNSLQEIKEAIISDVEKILEIALFQVFGDNLQTPLSSNWKNPFLRAYGTSFDNWMKQKPYEADLAKQEKTLQEMKARLATKRQQERFKGLKALLKQRLLDELPPSYQTLYKEDPESFLLAVRCWGITKDIRDKESNTLTHRAYKHASRQILALLQKYGINQAECKNNRGETPLIYAAIEEEMPHYTVVPFYKKRTQLCRMESQFVHDIKQAIKELANKIDQIEEQGEQDASSWLCRSTMPDTSTAKSLLDKTQQILQKVSRECSDESLCQNLKQLLAEERKEEEITSYFKKAIQDSLKKYEKDQRGDYALKWPSKGTIARQNKIAQEIQKWEHMAEEAEGKEKEIRQFKETDQRQKGEIQQLKDENQQQKSTIQRQESENQQQKSTIQRQESENQQQQERIHELESRLQKNENQQQKDENQRLKDENQQQKSTIQRQESENQQQQKRIQELESKLQRKKEEIKQLQLTVNLPTLKGEEWQEEGSSQASLLPHSSSRSSADSHAFAVKNRQGEKKSPHGTFFGIQFSRTERKDTFHRRVRSNGL